MSETLMTIFYSAAAAVIAFALLMSFDTRAGRRDQVICFTAMLIALLAHILGQLLITSGGYQFAPHLVGAELSIRMVLGPAVLFYTSALVSPSPIGFDRRGWIALTGPALVILASVPYLLLSAEEKLALADPATRDPAHFQMALFACTTGIVLFLVFTSYYLFSALRLQARHRREMMNQFANIERRSLDWLRNMLLVFAVVWLFLGIKQVLWLSGISAPYFYVGLALAEMLSIAAFAYLGLRQPSPLLDAGDAEQTTRTPILAREHMERLASKLTRALVTDRLYARSDLSLRDLSDITGATKNHISETLSQHLGVNFFDFVNRCRIDEAKRLLAETDDTVLEIGFEVGFNSRSTFNAAFKKHAGSTPSAYRSMSCEDSAPVLKRA
ncbi:helix-turn-helix domain-containing protein [Erythrobacter sp. GH1-10]|uniref:helix-turn-helix domain-containing protein n=1 Tax=Erythrobacter sp. GH1-10 TaxID=3349334 RepID=UPI003877EA6E